MTDLEYVLLFAFVILLRRIYVLGKACEEATEAADTYAFGIKAIADGTHVALREGDNYIIRRKPLAHD